MILFLRIMVQLAWRVYVSESLLNPNCYRFHHFFLFSRIWSKMRCLINNSIPYAIVWKYKYFSKWDMNYILIYIKQTKYKRRITQNIDIFKCYNTIKKQLKYNRFRVTLFFWTTTQKHSYAHRYRHTHF